MEEKALNIDENVQKIINLLLRRWKLLVLFALIGSIVAYAYTNQFTTLTYTSTVEFLAYVDDSSQELQDSTGSSSTMQETNAQQRVSETSKMNYAMKMLSTYIEVFRTVAFNETVSEYLHDNYGENYSASAIRSATAFEAVEGTPLFKAKITTTDPELSYNIAQSLVECIPQSMSVTNKGLVLASVEDPPLKAGSAESMNYPKKCAVGAVAGIVLAAAFVIVKDLFDIRIKGSEELARKYEIPVLGSVPYFDDEYGRSKKKKKKKKKANNTAMNTADDAAKGGEQ